MCILRYRLKLEHAGKDAIAQVKWIRASIHTPGVAVRMTP